MKSKTRFVVGFLTAGLVFNSAFEARAQDGNDQSEMKAPAQRSVEVSKGRVAKTVRTGVPDPVADNASSTGISGHLMDFLRDQEQIWTSPTRVRSADAKWLVPLGGLTAGLFATDRQYSASLSQNPATIRHYRTFSNLGVASLAGSGAGLFLLSYPAHNEHWRETGFLAGEAALNSVVAVEALKYSFARQRPFQGDGSGSFFHGGTSFPSAHAAAAWSIAGVISHEYPGTLPKLFAYGMASAVSFSRVDARRHFPSDVVVGSALGYLIAQSLYSRRHNPEVGGAAWESPREIVNQERVRTPDFMGSPYVPLDSWIYSAIERLAALGYVKTASLGIRPWTRLECARLLTEATDLPPDVDMAPEVQDLAHSLSAEFGQEMGLMSGETNVHAHLESVYQRSLGISGNPLTDGYHFGQTVLNDYGRPFQQGFNTVAGISGWAAAGPFVIYARGEYQHAPSGPAVAPAVLGFISSADNLPPGAPSTRIATISQFRVLDAYVAMNVANWQMSFGRQSLWWGPSEGGTMAFTNNAAPINMFRLNRISPFRPPWILGYLGDVRFDFFLGQLSGQQFINNGAPGTLPQGQYGRNLSPQPFLSGGRVSFRFTQNLEVSISKTTIYGGPGNPLTWKTFLQSALSLPATGEHLGDGRAVLDFSYRIPKLRNWLSVYGEGFTEDRISPLYKPERSVWQGGLYFAKLPSLSKLDLRVEGGSTSPVAFSVCNGCFYHNFQYVNGYTNNGQLMGTWIGRAAQGESVWSNYWFSPTRKIGVELRHRKVDRQFLPQGGTQNDAALNADFLTRSGFRFSSTLQYERWQIPLLAANRQSNVTASFQIGYWPPARAK